MRTQLFALLFLVTICPLMAASAQNLSANTRISAPVLYDSTMLVLVSDEGVSAVVFRPTAKGGAAYDFRYEGRNGEKVEGANRPLFESRVKEVKSELFIKTGPISIEWSRGGEDRGWIYYEPEKLQVHLANAMDFADRLDDDAVLGGVRTIPKLDLRRFLNRRMP